MKKQYFEPDLLVFQVTTGASILSVSNGQNLNMTTYGSRDVDSDECDGFWD